MRNNQYKPLVAIQRTLHDLARRTHSAQVGYPTRAHARARARICSSSFARSERWTRKTGVKRTKNSRIEFIIEYMIEFRLCSGNRTQLASATQRVFLKDSCQAADGDVPAERGEGQAWRGGAGRRGGRVVGGGAIGRRGGRVSRGGVTWCARARTQSIIPSQATRTHDLLPRTVL